AHMVAGNEEELLHLVRHSIDVLHSTSSENSIRVLTHAAYRGQTLIVRLLDLATSQQIQLKDAGIDHQGSPAQDSERFTEQRLDLWTHLRDDQD
ncbi:MAG: hypothetical protein V3S32_01330, partial [Acidimicrobiia bacterium]